MKYTGYGLILTGLLTLNPSFVFDGLLQAGLGKAGQELERNEYSKDVRREYNLTKNEYPKYKGNKHLKEFLQDKSLDNLLQ